MAVVGRREFTTPQLRAVFAALDDGGTRDDVRATVRRLQGRGISNDAIREVRLAHKAVRRSQGYNLKDHGPRRVVDALGEPVPLRKLPASRRLALSRRPAPPKIPGIDFQVTAVFSPRTRGRTTGRARVNVFDVGSGAASLAQQIAEAAEALGYGSPISPPTTAKASGTTILRVRSPI